MGLALWLQTEALVAPSGSPMLTFPVFTRKYRVVFEMGNSASGCFRTMVRAAIFLRPDRQVARKRAVPSKEEKWARVMG